MTVRLFALILTALLPAAPAFSQNDPNRKDWVQLFNGKDLTGWTPKITHYALGDNFGNTFRVEDGLMKVRYDAYDTFNGRFGHIFYKDKFAYYIIATEYRFTGEQAKGGRSGRSAIAAS